MQLEIEDTPRCSAVQKNKQILVNEFSERGRGDRERATPCRISWDLILKKDFLKKDCDLCNIKRNLVGFSLQKQFQIPQAVLWNSTVFLKGEAHKIGKRILLSWPGGAICKNNPRARPPPSPSKHVKWPARHTSPTAPPPDQPPKDAIRRATKCTHRDKVKEHRARAFHTFIVMSWVCNWLLSRLLKEKRIL